jgi:hypothetical protein
MRSREALRSNRGNWLSTPGYKKSPESGILLAEVGCDEDFAKPAHLRDAVWVKLVDIWSGDDAPGVGWLSSLL